MKKLYETPEMEEIRFASLDAIALSDTGEYDENAEIDDSKVSSGNTGFDSLIGGN